jgi:Protein of unknown function (DUF4038)/Putative collagen-binding domain of a collagenase
LVDQNNTPFMMVGDSPQAMVTNLTLAQASSYVSDRASHGFNALLVDVLVYPYTGGNSTASTYDGIVPFTKTISGGEYDLTSPNEAYFERVDSMVSLATQQGLLVLLDPCETGGWTQTMVDNGTASCRAYGQYLANRYKNVPNLMWISGNDFQNWEDATKDAAVVALAQGIQSGDPNHLQTIELEYFASSSLDDPNWAPIVGLNLAYTYYPTYAEVLHAYGQSSTTPTFMGEAYYESVNGQAGLGEMGTPQLLRHEEYWTMTCGATGQLYGNNVTWDFASGWQQNLDTVGVTQLGYMASLFQAIAWYNLVPDTSHSVITGGYGTFSNNTGTVGGDTYMTDASAPDGTLAVAYMPTVRTVTVNLAKFSGPVTARWYDPTNGSYATIAGSPFSNSGSAPFTPAAHNSGGDPDWVLLLTTGSLSLPPPVSPNPPTNSSTPRLVNISARAQVGTGGNILIPGFVIGGSGTETLLIRADGPALTAFGVSGVLAQPTLSVFDNTGAVIASNTGWGTDGDPDQVASAAASVGAFALASGSADCALIANLPAGAYTVQISGVNNSTGIALAEVYEVASAGTSIVDLSIRSQVGTGSDIIVAGFVIGGPGPEPLLARADGPALSAFGVAGALAQPSLSVFDNSGNVIVSNTGWGTGPNPALVASDAVSVGAFALASGSADSAQIASLSPGAYTMQVSGLNGTTGIALAEVYALP